MIGMIHTKPGAMPTLVGRMPAVPGLPTNTSASGVQLLGPPGWERAASTGSFWDRVAAKGYEIPPGGLHGGLGAPIVHGMGLGAWGAVSDADLDKMAAAMAAKKTELGAGDIADAMKLLTKDERDKLGAKLIALGVLASTVGAGKMLAKTADPGFKRNLAIYGVLSTVSMAASAYHGYKRNDSIGWALWWGFMGSMFPVITPVIGVAQGFGKPKR